MDIFAELLASINGFTQGELGVNSSTHGQKWYGYAAKKSLLCMYIIKRSGDKLIIEKKEHLSIIMLIWWRDGTGKGREKLTHHSMNKCYDNDLDIHVYTTECLANVLMTTTTHVYHWFPLSTKYLTHQQLPATKLLGLRATRQWQLNSNEPSNTARKHLKPPETFLPWSWNSGRCLKIMLFEIELNHTVGGWAHQSQK